MPSHDTIDLLQHKDVLKIRQIGEKQKIFDPIRKKWYVLRPEEFVRQLVIVHLNAVLAYPLTLIGIEKQLQVHGMTRRFDLVVFDKKALPHILIECKSPKEKLNEGAALQIANYNIELNARYLWLSNGKENLFYYMDYDAKGAKPIADIPKYEN